MTTPTRRIREPIRGHALTVLAAYAEQDWVDDDADIAAACDALRAGGGRALVLCPSRADTVADGLVYLANIEDEGATRTAARDPGLARMMRAACAGLSGAAVRVRTAAWRAA